MTCPLKQAIIAVLFLFIFSQEVAAQDAGVGPGMPFREEIPARSVNETYRIIPFGMRGFAMFYRTTEPEEGGRIRWYFSWYDTAMIQQWVRSVPFGEGVDFMGVHRGSDTLSLLFAPGQRSKEPAGSFDILRIVPEGATLILNSGSFAGGGLVETFAVSDDRAWLGINDRGGAGQIMQMRLTDGHSTIFPLGVGEQISVLALKPGKLAPTVSAVVSRQVSKKRSENYFVTYDTAGNIVREMRIDGTTSERVLIRARITETGNGAYFVYGLYGQGGAASGSRNHSPAASTGLYTCLIPATGLPEVRYLNFLEMKQARSLMGDAEFAELMKKAGKKQVSLSEYSLDMPALLQEAVPDGNRFLVTAELFSPQYHTENFTDFDFYGRPYTNSYSVFDGYRYYSAVVVLFDSLGRPEWDNNVEMRNVVSRELQPRVVTCMPDERVVMAYLTDGKIGSKILKDGEVNGKLDFTMLDMLHPDDKLVTETNGNLSYWYANYFLACGYQEIRNIALEANNKRLVFYFSKIKFED